MSSIEHLVYQKLQEVISLVREHNRWRRYECLNLIPSENVMSKLGEYVYLNDMMSRYAEGTVGNRYYQGTKYIDALEAIVQELMGMLFGSKYVDIRPISGTVANFAAFRALTEQNDVVAALTLFSGAHISHREVGSVGMLRLKIVDLPWSDEEFNVDVDRAVKLIYDKRPKLVILGGSLYLFPHPVKELADAVHEVSGYLVHDSAHVLGLIAGKAFPNPLEHNCDVMTSSTHKTFPGPQGGVIFTNDESLFKRIQKAVFPGITSNYHHHRYAATAVTALEMMRFGQEYARQMVRNARRLAEELHNQGLKVLAEHKNFTQTHQVALDVSSLGGGAKCAYMLEQANIIVNKNVLPHDRSPKNPSGLRLGVQEVTRYGMREDDMTIIAKFIADVLLKRRDVDAVRRDVIEFRRQFTEVKYGFDLSDVGINETLRMLM